LIDVYVYTHGCAYHYVQLINVNEYKTRFEKLWSKKDISK